jgi:hypothetical protein
MLDEELIDAVIGGEDTGRGGTELSTRGHGGMPLRQ